MSGRPPSPYATSKVPAVTLVFWLTKILATTLGETAGDTLSMSLGFGYLAATAVFGGVLILLLTWQIAADRYSPALYWGTIIASTTAGTTLADFATRSLGIGYAGGSALLLACVLASLGTWRWSTGAIAVDHIADRRAELFYWMTITFSQTLGTALGDWTADTNGVGYGGAAAIFGGLLVILALLYATALVSRTLLFWSAFILTRPLGAALGDLLDKPVDHGGLALSRAAASAVLALAIALILVILPPRATTTSPRAAH